MKNLGICASIVILIAAGLSVQAWSAQAGDEKLFQEIKLLVFDEKWEEAQSKLDDFLSKYPRSSYFSQALYYKSKCLEEQEGKERDALASYKEYLRLKDKNKNLAEDAEISIIDLAMKLYDRGDAEYVKEVEDRLPNSNKVVRYYAAVQLSYVKEVRIADKSVPVLKQIIKEEKNTELRDRARIALLRVSPDALAEIENHRDVKRVRMLKIVVTDDRTKKMEFQLNIPWALADLALSAIPDKEKAAIRQKGYDINRILKDLESAKGTVLEIKDTKEGKTFKIWIE
jgi:tetratricopeptide (TPR) repeat protein